MANNAIAVKCQFCKNKTTDPSGRCYIHQNISSAKMGRMNFGKGLTPKLEVSIDESGKEMLYLPASDIQSNIDNGLKYEMDITDGYGEEFAEIDSITHAGKPNEGLLAFNTNQGMTTYFLPTEYVDVRIKTPTAVLQ